MFGSVSRVLLLALCCSHLCACPLQVKQPHGMPVNETKPNDWTDRAAANGLQGSLFRDDDLSGQPEESGQDTVLKHRVRVPLFG